MNSFTYVEPAGVDEALAALVQYGDEAKLIAGGTGLINLMKQQLVQPSYLIGMRRLPLTTIAGNGELRLGALATLRALENSDLVRRQVPMLAQAIHLVATVRIRTQATIGGAVSHADPAQDTPPALLALDARVKIRSPRGEREVALDQFFTGYYETVLQPDELVTEVIVPAQPAGSSAVYLKFLPQTHDDYATVAVAARVAMAGGKLSNVRVALGAAGSTPIRARAVEDALTNQAPTLKNLREAAALVEGAVDPTSDFRGSAGYKREMAVVFVRRALEQALTAAGHKLA
jgi:carbon-monoxide dehydrogenase medium subunit